MSGQFWVFRCKNCGQWGVKELRIEIKDSKYTCKYCNKSAKIKPKTQYGLALMNKGPFENPKTATQVCQTLNELNRSE